MSHEDQIVPAKMANQPIASGYVDPHRPFLRADVGRSGGVNVERIHRGRLLRSPLSRLAEGGRRVSGGRVTVCERGTSSPTSLCSASLCRVAALRAFEPHILAQCLALVLLAEETTVLEFRDYQIDNRIEASR